MKLFTHLVLCLIVASVACATGPNLDNCDWFGSGTLEMALSKGVRPVYLRCNQGTVRWHYPQGALRIVLQHRSPGAPFSACVRRSKGSAGARLHLAGKRKLHLVFKEDDPPGLVRCVASRGGQVALYVEADPLADLLKKETTEFSYYLRKKTRRSEEGFSDDCQPCSEDQLLRQYCSSDFVIQGSVTSLFHNKLLQTTELTVRVSRMHRISTEQAFTELSNDLTLDSAGHPGYVVLQRPLRCGTKAGSGEYLFLGSWVLGNPSLNCVPRIAEWKKVRRKALKLGTNECILSL